MKKLGALVPVVTPCSKEGQPDLDGVKNVCKFFQDADAHGIFVLGSTGRGPWFGRPDREKICRAAKDQIGESLPLFAGCIALGLTDMLENARALAGCGANVAVITCPGYFNYNERETEAIFLNFADNSPLPVMIYDIPAFTGAQLDTAMVSRLAKHENVIGFKDSSADIERFRQLISTLNDIDDFYLIQGKEHLLADSIIHGASGITVSLVHINPKLFVELYEAALSGDAANAQDLQVKITDIMKITVACFEKRPEISTLFHFLNYALVKNGVCQNILLEHEGECPDWIAEKSAQAMRI